MARTKDRAERNDAPNAPKSVLWRLGAYIRLSKEDNVKSDDDSNSVKNQKKILTEYYRDHTGEFESTEIYIDDAVVKTPTSHQRIMLRWH